MEPKRFRMVYEFKRENGIRYHIFTFIGQFRLEYCENTGKLKLINDPSSLEDMTLQHARMREYGVWENDRELDFGQRKIDLPRIVRLFTTKGVDYKKERVRIQKALEDLFYIVKQARK